MLFKKKSKRLIVNVDKRNILSEDELKGIYGNGNSQIRYVPDEFVQARILKERGIK